MFPLVPCCDTPPYCPIKSHLRGAIHLIIISVSTIASVFSPLAMGWLRTSLDGKRLMSDQRDNSCGGGVGFAGAAVGSNPKRSVSTERSSRPSRPDGPPLLTSMQCLFSGSPLPPAPFSHPLPIVSLHTALFLLSLMAELCGLISGSLSPLFYPALLSRLATRCTGTAPASSREDASALFFSPTSGC